MKKLDLRDIFGKTRRKIIKAVFGKELVNNITRIDMITETVMSLSDSIIYVQRSIADTQKMLKEIGNVIDDKQNILLLQHDEIKHEAKWTSMRNLKKSIPNVSLAKLFFLLAGIETAKYIETHMPKTRVYHDQADILKECVTLAGEGLFLEFGVYSGRTINAIADAKINKTIHGFDSFEGLPETWRSGFEKGVFRKSKLPQVRNNVKLHIGWFENTLDEFVKAHVEYCAFIHIDCDLYSSTKTIFHYLKHRIISGSILLFDEYFNYPSWRDNEFKAFQEFIAEHNLTYEYIGYVEDHEQVAVRIL